MLDEHARRLVCCHLPVILWNERDRDALAFQVMRQRLGAGRFSSMPVSSLSYHTAHGSKQRSWVPGKQPRGGNFSWLRILYSCIACIVSLGGASLRNCIPPADSEKIRCPLDFVPLGVVHSSDCQTNTSGSMALCYVAVAWTTRNSW
jgi:hypothetical protein